ncbi:MAG: amidohydrolase family protein [Cyclobacteriaceae bacterium]
MKRLLRFLLIGILFYNCTSPERVPYDLAINGGRVMDPESGTDKVMNVGILDGKIAIVTEEEISATASVDAKGLVVAPGFIDLHEHGMTDETYGIMAHDGVTTAFELEVGTDSVAKWYEEREGGKYVNYGVSIGHIQVRMNVLGDQGAFLPSDKAIEERATEEQIASMQQKIEQGLKEGAIGVGFGLAYTPAATTEEFEAMLRVALGAKAPSFIHMRGGLEGIQEAIGTATKVGTPLHLVHINSSGGAQTQDFLDLVQKAQDAGYDITTEAYPYEAGMTRIESALFDGWEDWTDEQIAIHQWPETGEFLNRESFGRYRKEGGGIIIHSRTEEMTMAAIASPLTMIASDGFLADGKGHPRTAGTYSKVLGKYVRELKAMSLMDALAKMTIQPAKRLEGYVPQMANKGRLQQGADADIVIFNAEEVIDQSTYMEPALPPKGIPYVLVAGQLVIENGKLNEAVKPGVAIRK